MDITVAQSVRSHFMDLYVLQTVTVVPTTVIISAAVNNHRRQKKRQCQLVIHRQRQQVFKTVKRFFSYSHHLSLTLFIHHVYINE